MLNELDYKVKTNLKKSIARDIKLIVMDIDGILTNGNIYLNSTGSEIKSFNTKDGIGIRLLQKYGFKVALISGGTGEIIFKRAETLNIKHVFVGIEDKLSALIKLQHTLDIKPSQTAFLGDDINDLNVISKVRIFATPADGHDACKNRADLIGKKKGGNGFVREFVDSLLFGIGINPWEPFKTCNTI